MMWRRGSVAGVVAGLVLGFAAGAGPENLAAAIGRVTVRSASAVAERRGELLRFVWGEAGFPSHLLPTRVEPGVASPLVGLGGSVRRVDAFWLDMGGEEEGLAHLFLPPTPRDHLVVYQHGHSCSIDDGMVSVPLRLGIRPALARLLGAGYPVLVVYMPHFRPGDCKTLNHGAVLRKATAGSPLRFFLEPTAASLNLLLGSRRPEGVPELSTVSMVGLSGGGWATTVYAALDPRVRLSIAIAGSLPRGLRAGDSRGDKEQRLPGFYRLADYQDLYVLGSSGAGRRQVQVLNRRDDCCFGERADLFKPIGGARWDELLRAYEADVREALAAVGGGSFAVVIDEHAERHEISAWAVEELLLPELSKMP